MRFVFKHGVVSEATSHETIRLHVDASLDFLKKKKILSTHGHYLRCALDKTLQRLSLVHTK